MILKVLRLDISKYFFISCIVSLIDLIISFLIFKVTNVDYIIACNIGIITGFIIQFYACRKFIFKSKGLINSFIIYLVTFFIGIGMADLTMWGSFSVINLSFTVSKVFSMAVPFFITYSIRKLMLGIKSS